MPESDEELMLSLARRDEDDALLELMERYRHVLVNHFARRGVHHEYEDLAQETFVRIYKARKRYRVTASFRTWMYRIAQRVWIDHLRKNGRRNRRERAFREEPRRAHAAPEGMHAHDLQWALDQLSPVLRDVVVLAGLEQLPHQETAAILGIPEGTVKSRLHTAMRELKTHLSRESPDHETN